MVPARLTALLIVAAAALAVAAPAQAADPAPPDRMGPAPRTEIAFALRSPRPGQGGQRLRFTLPIAAGADAFGDTLTFSWRISGPDRSARCRPGGLPDVSAAPAGAAVDLPLAAPPRGWCRGYYEVALHLNIAGLCPADFPTCDPGHLSEYDLAYGVFRVGAEQKPICHFIGDGVHICRYPKTRANRAFWLVTAPLDALVGPDGATDDADRIFAKAFARSPRLQDYECDDDTYYGYPKTREQAYDMARAVKRVLRRGRFHHRR